MVMEKIKSNKNIYPCYRDIKGLLLCFVLLKLRKLYPILKFTMSLFEFNDIVNIN